MPIPVYLLNEYNCLILVTMVTWSRPEPVTGQCNGDQIKLWSFTADKQFLIGGNLVISIANEFSNIIIFHEVVSMCQNTLGNVDLF